MKPSTYRRIRRRSVHEAAMPKKDNQQEQSFFGEATQETFFQPAPAIQRKCADCEKEDKVQRVADKKEEEKVMKKEDKKEEKVNRAADKKDEEKVQKKNAAGLPGISGNVSRYINSLNGKGYPLSAKSNQFFSARLGYDFNNVKVHTGKEAADSAKTVNAKAYTIGNNVVFNEGQYNEESGEGRKLMAHELTHVVQQNKSTVQREPATVQEGEGTLAQKRKYVEDTILFLVRSADHYANPRVTINASIFDRVIQSWYSMIINQEKVIMNDLNKDAALLNSLRTAYQNALKILISKASVALNKTADEIFRQNNGRIPMWAWQIPHHTEAGFSMPIADGHTPQGRGRSRHIDYTIQNMAISILPDGTDRSLPTPGVTRIKVNGGRIRWSGGSGRRGTVTRLTGPGITKITIQVFYRPGVNKNAASGYGRGTTTEDLKGGEIDSGSTTIAFHEANHGLDYLAFLNSHPFPQFTGATGMLVSEVSRLAGEWDRAVTKYVDDLNKDTTLHTHCVGTTSDQFNAANGVALECAVP